MTLVVDGVEVIEFGYASRVSLETWERATDTFKDMVKQQGVSYLSVKCPDWRGEVQFVEGPVTSHQTIARKDGEPVSDDVRSQYYDWMFSDEEDETVFDMGDEYTTETVWFKDIGWYATVPVEFVKQD